MIPILEGAILNDETAIPRSVVSVILISFKMELLVVNNSQRGNEGMEQPVREWDNQLGKGTTSQVMGQPMREWNNQSGIWTTS